jgi:hypothetical protein
MHTSDLACDVAVEGADAHRLLSLALQLGFKGIDVQQKSQGCFFAPGYGDRLRAVMVLLT